MKNLDLAIFKKKYLELLQRKKSAQGARQVTGHFEKMAHKVKNTRFSSIWTKVWAKMAHFH